MLLGGHWVNTNRMRSALPPANVLLTRGPGTGLPRMTPSVNERFNAKFTLLADLPIEMGVGMLAGCECREYDSSDEPKETYKSLVPEIAKLIKEDTVTVVHIKGPDEYGHDGDFSGKTQNLEGIDAWLIKPLMEIARESCLFLVTSDHATPCSLRAHSSDKVPFILSGPGVLSNGAIRLTESACATLLSPVRRGAELLAFAVAVARR
jgi:2,3-bisphosphoglycerate-independent phosphoglycerate mutase